jgi:chromosome segregation ATPase
LDEERARSAALASELATAQREIETQAGLLRKASEETGQLRQATESAMTDLRQSLQQERDRTEAMARGLESARRTIDVRVSPELGANSHLSKAEQAIEVAAMAQPTAVEAQGSPEVTRLMERANALLGQGNIGAARIVLARATETGSVQANFMLAETYDPVILSAWGTYGTRGDATKARELYAKAHAGGIQKAKDRLDALDR